MRVRTTRALAIANWIGAAPASVPVIVATVITQARALVVVVPQAPEPMVPAVTLNVVDGRVPSLLAVIGVASAVLQPVAEVAVARHCTA